MNPLVSVIMPAFNASAFLKEAVESVIAQTYTDWELILINDGSTDTTSSVMHGFSDPRIVCIENTKNIGIIETRNLGVEKAKGKYIAMLDSDDISLPQRLQKQVDYLEKHPEVAMISSKIYLIDQNGKEKGIWPEDFHTVTPRQIKEHLPTGNCIAQSTVMLRSELIKKYKYDKRFLHNEDWALWLDLIYHGHQIAKLDEVLVKYRVHSDSITVKVNKEGVGKKLLRFKKDYLKAKNDSSNPVCRAMKATLFRDKIRYNFPKLYKVLALTNKVKAVDLISQRKAVRKAIKKNPDIKVVFLFPYYHTGGAELVHLSVLKTLLPNQSLTLITGKSRNNNLLPQYKLSTDLIHVNTLTQVGPMRNWLSKKLSTLALLNPGITFFSCNEKYFYELVPNLPSSVKCVDLLHAFVHAYEDGPEKWSLPVVDKLDKRIIISGNTLQNFKELYSANNIDQKFLERIELIENYTDHRPPVNKKSGGPLKVLYVGRGGIEKRVHLISAAARALAEKKSNVEISFVGDVEQVIPEEDKAYCKLYGEMNDQEKMNEIYKEHHVVLIVSSREGFPMVIMEGMMNGLVPVSTNVGGISFHVNECNGILLKSQTEELIVNELTEVISKLESDRNLLLKLSSAAYTYACEHFNKDKFDSAYKKLWGN